MFLIVSLFMCLILLPRGFWLRRDVLRSLVLYLPSLQFLLLLDLHLLLLGSLLLHQVLLLASLVPLTPLVPERKKRRFNVTTIINGAICHSILSEEKVRPSFSWTVVHIDEIFIIDHGILGGVLNGMPVGLFSRYQGLNRNIYHLHFLLILVEVLSRMLEEACCCCIDRGLLVGILWVLNQLTFSFLTNWYCATQMLRFSLACFKCLLATLPAYRYVNQVWEG